jgi:hypothetical protein
VSKTNAGEAVYEHIKDHNYEPSYYFERCEGVLVDSLKMDLIRRNKDCEVMRLDEFNALFGDKDLESADGKQRSPTFKLKYMCRKCQPR